MYERRPLLSSAKIGVPVHTAAMPLHLWIGVVALSICVIIGAVDIFSRISRGMIPAEPVAQSQSVFATSEQAIDVFVPERLSIASVGVSAQVERVGLTADGAMATPSTFDRTAWYRGSAQAGGEGATVIAGHLNNSLGLSGVFERLDRVALGDSIVVEGEGKTLRYRVIETSVYEVDKAPNEQLFSTTGSNRLILITCDGAWDHNVRSYDKRLIVIAEPI